MTCPLKVALFSAFHKAVTETFVHYHVSALPADVLHFHGGPYAWTLQGRPLLPLGLRALRALGGILPGVWSGFARDRMDRRIARVLRERRVDVVLAEFANAALDLVDPCLAAGVPLVVHCHGYDVYVRTLVNPQRHRYERLFRHAAAVIVVSRAMRTRVIELGAPPESVHLNPCGVDSSLFSSDPGPRPPRLIAVGRFVEKKAPHLTLRAFALAHTRFPDARLEMIGDGSLLSSGRKLARDLGLRGAVEFLGSVPHERVAERLKGARAFVQHSVTAANGDSEGTPVAILEAAAAGLPVVSTRHAGIADAVLEGETGFLVDEGDVEGMAERMLWLLRDPALAVRMGRKAQIRASEVYDLRRSLDRLYEILTIAAGADA